MNYVIFLGLCQAMIALLLLPATKAKRPANEWLRWLLVCICLHLTFKFIIFTVVPFVEIRRTFNTFVGLAYGPLLWIFAQKINNDRFKPFRYWYIFLPAVVGAFGYLFVAISTLIHGQEPTLFLEIYNKYILYVGYVMVIFPILTLRIARQLADFWSIERRLLRQFSIILISLFGVAVVAPFLPYFVNDLDKVYIGIRIVVYSQLLVACVLIIQYELSLQRVLGQTMQPIPVITNEAPKEEITEIRKTLLDDEQLLGLKMRLTQLMEKEKIYTDPELSLEKLAALLQVPRNQASELINLGVGKSFYQYINEYRIREVVRLLDKCIQHGASPNILSLAFDAGFHSKSSFNGYFKKVTGHTPSAYLKRTSAVDNVSLI
jgi:AraC-like DNA-binding protein